jgi:uncharacterized membrane protein YhaH (DUF805 family)
MSMFEYYISAMKKSFVYKGRARRSEFWYFYLVSIILQIIGSVLDSTFGLADAQGNGPISAIVSLVHIFATISAGARRMHDIDKSGWYQIIPIYNIFLLARNGDAETNRFGTDPKNPLDGVSEVFN